jgi:hypothetical protein
MGRASRASRQVVLEHGPLSQDGKMQFHLGCRGVADRRRDGQAPSHRIRSRHLTCRDPLSAFAQVRGSPFDFRRL